MTSRVLRVFPRHFSVLVVTAAFSVVDGYAQKPAPASATVPAQSEGVALLGTSSPAGSQAQSQKHVSGAAQGRSSSSQPAILSYGAPGTHVIVPENTLIHLMTDQSLSSKKSKAGQSVLFTVSEDAIVNHVLAIPRGATVQGEVVQTKKAGRLSGSPELTLKLLSLDLGGQSYPLYAYHFRVLGTSKTMPTANEMGQAVEFGALAGAVVSAHSKGVPTRTKNAEDMAAGAAVVAGAVEAASALESRPVVDLPAESEMDFYLALPISVQAVSAKDAGRLARRLHTGGPVLYVRRDTP